MQNPFKPGLPADPEFFGDRESQLRTFSEYLGYAISSNPNHMAVMGEAGIGKSSLLRKCDDIARGRGCISVRRELDVTVNSISSLIIFMLEALRTDGSSNLPVKMRAKTKVSGFFTSYKVGLSAFGFGGSLEKQQAPQIAFQDAFYKELIHIWGGIEQNVPAVVFLLDEAEHLRAIEGGWSFLRSVFTRVGEQGGRYMLVVSGRLGLFAGIKEKFSPIERFLVPVDLKPMSADEVKEVLEKPLLSFSRKITKDGVERVSELSAGHPYVAQVFGFYLFEDGATKIDANTVQKVLPRVGARLSGQLFKDRFDSASNAEKRVLLSMAETHSPVSPKDVSKRTGMSAKDTPQIVSRLVGKGCLRKVERGRYVLFNPMFGDYVMGRMSK